MTVTPNFVPRNFKTVNIILTVNDGEKALAFYNSAFGAEITEKLIDDEGLIKYAEFRIEDTILMLREDKNFEGPRGVTFQIYTGDVEGLVESLKMAGAIEIEAIHEQLLGDRAGKLRDPFGFEWVIATHVEDLSVNELHKRFHAQFSENLW